MRRSVEEINKVSGTCVVLLKIKYWQEELDDIWAVLVEADKSGVFELSINHGIECKCCTKIPKESYTRPTRRIQAKKETR